MPKLGPVKASGKPPSLPTVLDASPARQLSKASPSDVSADEEAFASQVSDAGMPVEQLSLSSRHSRKRKRRFSEDDVEGKFMHRLAQQDARGEGRGADNVEHLDDGSDRKVTTRARREEHVIPSNAVAKHVSISTSEKEQDMEKSKRTIFLANVSTLAIKSKIAKKTLLDHLTSFIPALPDEHIKHAIESIRFRSVAFASSGAPKKATFAKRALMDSTTKSTNAYAVYTTQIAAREATRKLNGTIVLDRHLRVDSLAHPAQQDHRRCVFIGNLAFVDDESSMNAAEDELNQKKPRKAKEAADIEEGLWRQFLRAGDVESVRVVRGKLCFLAIIFFLDHSRRAVRFHV